MKVRITKTDNRLGIKEGEIYEAEIYWLDPDKITLLKRIPDGYEPSCNQYRYEVEILSTK